MREAPEILDEFEAVNCEVILPWGATWRMAILEIQDCATQEMGEEEGDYRLVLVGLGRDDLWVVDHDHPEEPEVRRARYHATFAKVPADLCVDQMEGTHEG